MSFNEEDVVEIIKNKWEEFKNENMDPDNAVNKILDKLGDWIGYNNKRQRLVIKTLLSEVEQTNIRIKNMKNRENF
jgi:hypothetical protein